MVKANIYTYSIILLEITLTRIVICYNILEEIKALRNLVVYSDYMVVIA